MRSGLQSEFDGGGAENRDLEAIRDDADYFLAGVRVKTPRAIKKCGTWKLSSPTTTIRMAADVLARRDAVDVLLTCRQRDGPSDGHGRPILRPDRRRGTHGPTTFDSSTLT